jgi:hypothetical protein
VIFAKVRNSRDQVLGESSVDAECSLRLRLAGVSARYSLRYKNSRKLLGFATIANVKNRRDISDFVPRISPSEIARNVSIGRGNLRLGQRITSCIDIQYPLFVVEYINLTRTSFWSNAISRRGSLVRRCAVHESCSSFIFHPQSQLCRQSSCPLSTREEP